MTPAQRRPERGFDDSLPDIVALTDTDLLLDRLGQRAPDADDLDHPLLAALAVLAADVDLDEVAPQRTRRTLQQHGLWPPRFDQAVTRAGRRTELPESDPGVVGALAAPRSRTGPARTRARALAEEARKAPSSAVSVLVDPRRTVRIRLVPALAAAGAAVILSMGAAAALTKGESVNPAQAIATVVAQIAGEASPRSLPGSATTPAGAGAHPDPGANDPTSATGVGAAGADVVPPGPTVRDDSRLADADTIGSEPAATTSAPAPLVPADEAPAEPEPPTNTAVAPVPPVQAPRTSTTGPPDSEAAVPSNRDHARPDAAAGRDGGHGRGRADSRRGSVAGR